MNNFMNVLNNIEGTGAKAWLVGDAARMIIMGIKPMNLTFVSDCDLEVLSKKVSGLALDFQGKFSVLRGSVLGIPTEVHLMQGETIEDDLSRRDFSINAIAIKGNGGVVDPFGGRGDARNKIVRLTGDDVELLKRDPLRVVRMLRFAAELKMDIFWKSETDVKSFIRQNREFIRNTPSERWGREIFNGMRQRPWNFITLCNNYGLIELFLEELEELKSVKISEDKSYFDLTLDMLRRVQNFTEKRKEQDEDIVLSMAALFLYIGATSQDSSDKTRAIYSAMRCLQSWNSGSEILNRVSSVLREYRMFYESRTEDELCASVLENGIEAMDATFDFAMLASQTENANHKDILSGNRWRLGQVLRRFDSVRRRVGNGHRFFRGDDIMKLLKLEQGRRIGEILHGLDMAVGTGVVSNRKEAEDWVLRHGSEF